MNVNELHYSFKIKADKVDSLKTKNFLPAEIDWILNESIQEFVDNKYHDFETKQDLIDQLSSLVIKSPTSLQSGLVPTVETTGVYKIDLGDLSYPYLHLVRLNALGSKTGCSNKILKGRQVSHDELDKVLLSPFEGPNYTWSNLPYVFGKSNSSDYNSGIFLYTNQEFNLLEIYPEYLKQPIKVFYGGYNSLDGQYIITDPEVNCDLPEAFHRRIVDIAVAEAYRYMNSEAFQLKYQKLLNQ